MAESDPCPRSQLPFCAQARPGAVPVPPRLRPGSVPGAVPVPVRFRPGVVPQPSRCRSGPAQAPSRPSAPATMPKTTSEALLADIDESEASACTDKQPPGHAPFAVEQPKPAPPQASALLADLLTAGRQLDTQRGLPDGKREIFVRVCHRQAGPREPCHQAHVSGFAANERPRDPHAR